jgi:hypothetical protein
LDSEEHAAQLDRLKEMAVDARGEAKEVSVTFTPIVTRGCTPRERSTRWGFDGLSLALYEDTADEDLPLRLTTALRIPGGAAVESDGLTTIDLPAVERAATTVVRGAPDRFPDAFRALHEPISSRNSRCTVSRAYWRTQHDRQAGGETAHRTGWTPPRPAARRRVAAGPPPLP